MVSRSNENSGYSREQKVVSVYIRATGSEGQIFDHNFRPLTVDDKSCIEQSICLHCTSSAHCREMHVNAIRESGRRGRPYTYQCDLGMMFWVSPIFKEGKFSGALRGSGFVSDIADNTMLTRKCNGTIPPEEFTRRVSAFSSGDTEKIQSLAEMLQMCAESLSTGNKNYHDALRLRSEQQASLSVLVDELKAKYPNGANVSGYPFDKERQLIASLQRGDKEEAGKVLNELLAILVFSNPDNFRNIQFRVLELAILLTRVGINPDTDSTMEINTRRLRQIQESKSVDEITGIMHNIIETIAGQIVSFQDIPHALAMRKAETFIRENLTRKMTLREISRVAGLSAPYFSTIFKEEMGENLSKYINRLRVEKASALLLETDISLNEISGICCFQDQSWFSKIFKSFTGISPGKYRNQGGLLYSQRSSADG